MPERPHFLRRHTAIVLHGAAVCLLLGLMLATALPAQPAALARTQDQANSENPVERAQELERHLLIFQAADVLESAAAQGDSTTPGLLEFRAWFHHRYEFREEAVAAFEHLQNEKPWDFGIHEMLGWNRRALGQSSRALEHLLQVYQVTSDPITEAARFERIVTMSREKLRRDIDAAQAALATAPDDSQLQRRLLELHQYAANHEQVIELSDRMLRDHPNDDLVRLARATALERSRRLDDAAAAFAELIAAHPDSAYLWYRLGRVQQTAPSNGAAIESLERARELHADSIYIRRRLAELRAAEGQTSEAFAVLPREHETGGRSLEARLGRAHAHHFSGDLVSAIPIYRGILHDYPDNAEAVHGLSEALVYTGRYRESAAVIHRAENAGQIQTVHQMRELYRQQTAPRLNVFGSAYLNSSDFHRYDAGLHASGRAAPDLKLEGGYQFSRFVQKGFTSLDRHFVWAGAEFDLTDSLTIIARLGGTFYDNSNENLYARAGARWRAADNLTLSFDYERLDVADIETGGDFLIFNQATIGAPALGLDAHQFSPAFHFTHDRFDWHGKFAWADFSDGNQRRSWWTEVLYRLWNEPQFHVGYSYYYLDLANPAPLFTQNFNSVTAYFDPIDFEAHTLILRLSDEICERWRLGIEERVSYIPKADGLGSGTFVFLSHELSDRVNLRADVRFFHQSKSITRSGPAGEFNAAQFVLGLEVTF